IRDFHVTGVQTCALPIYAIDGTYFEKDDGGIGAKVVFGNASGYPLAKVEFHPYGEKLMMYDVVNDGDGLYYKVSYEGDGGKYGVDRKSVVQGGRRASRGW